MNAHLELLDDESLLAKSRCLANQIAQSEADLIAVIGEIDRRGSYTREACTSTRNYCETVLDFTRADARKQVAVAQLSRRVPDALRYLTNPVEQRIRLNRLAVLAPHLSPENADYLLPRSVRRTTAQIEALLASHAADTDRAGHDRNEESGASGEKAPATSMPRAISFAASSARSDLENAGDVAGDEVAKAVSVVIALVLSSAIPADGQHVVDDQATPATRPVDRGAGDRCADCAGRFSRPTRSDSAPFRSSPNHSESSPRSGRDDSGATPREGPARNGPSDGDGAGPSQLRSEGDIASSGPAPSS